MRSLALLDVRSKSARAQENEPEFLPYRPRAADTLHYMAMAVHLPDEVAGVLCERADERGVTVAEFICELVERSDRRRALETFIGGADEPVHEPFDIHRAREESAGELLKEHQAISEDFAGRRVRSTGHTVGHD